MWVLIMGQGAANPEMRTPNLDELAREGVILEACTISNLACHV